LQKWILDVKKKDLYVYEFERVLIGEFLDYIYIERNRTAQTRNNYLNVLRVFSGFLVEKGYANSRPTDVIKTLRKGEKERKVLKESDLQSLFSHLETSDKHYLLACKVLYYTFIRPKEMSKICIKHILLERKMIFVPSGNSKNHKSANVAIPVKLHKLLVELEIEKYNPEWFLFSDKFMPGPIRKTEKSFRDKWISIRKKLKFPETYKFYSLKDTGITDMIRSVGDVLIVRDQARHHSLSITDLYTDKEFEHANSIITKLDY